jgi:hypothetical protein
MTRSNPTSGVDSWSPYGEPIGRLAEVQVSTRLVEGLDKTLGIERLSRSHVREIAKSLDAMVADFCNRLWTAALHLCLARDTALMVEGQHLSSELGVRADAGPSVASDAGDNVRRG